MAARLRTMSAVATSTTATPRPTSDQAAIDGSSAMGLSGCAITAFAVSLPPPAAPVATAPARATPGGVKKASTFLWPASFTSSFAAWKRFLALTKPARDRLLLRADDELQVRELLALRAGAEPDIDGHVGSSLPVARIDRHPLVA